MEENLYLESDEEITSVIDKVIGAANPKVNLVVPRGATLLQSVVNLKLLKKEAEDHHKEIAVITQDKVGRNFAFQVGLPVFDDIKKTIPARGAQQPQVRTDEVLELDMSHRISEIPKDVQVHHYQDQKAHKKLFVFPGKPHPEEKVFQRTEVQPTFSETPQAKPAGAKKPPYLKILLILVGLLIIFAAADLFLAQVTASLVVPAESFEKSTEITVDGTIPRSNFQEGKIHGEEVLVEANKSQSFDATGQKQVGEKAKGQVTLYNDAGVDQELTAGSGLKASGKNLTTDEAVTVPKATLSAAGDKVRGQATVSVTAEEPGEDYNISSSTSFAVISNNKLTAVGGTSGGTTETIKVVSAEDISSARDKLLVDLTKEILPQLQNKAKDYYIVESAISNEVIDFTVDSKAGDEAQKFTATIKAKAKVIAFRDSEFRQLTMEGASVDLPASKQLIVGKNDTILPEFISCDWSKKELKLRSILKAHLGDRINEADIAKFMRLKTVSQARQYLLGLPKVQSATIQFKPAWVPKILPIRSKNIKVKLDYQ